MVHKASFNSHSSFNPRTLTQCFSVEKCHLRTGLHFWEINKRRKNTPWAWGWLGKNEKFFQQDLLIMSRYDVHKEYTINLPSLQDSHGQKAWHRLERQSMQKMFLSSRNLKTIALLSLNTEKIYFTSTFWRTPWLLNSRLLVFCFVQGWEENL